MSRTVLAFPVLSGKSADARLVADEFRARPREYEQSRRRAGITLERAYLQETPMGSFVIAYIEATADFATVSQMAQSGLDIDRFFVKTVKEVHGVDLSQSQAALPETIAGWFDPDVAPRGQGMAFCAPLLAETLDEALSYLPQAYASREFAASRRALGQHGEVVSLLQTPLGPLGAGYLEGVDPFEANRRFAASYEPFDVTFKAQLRRFFPPSVDFDKPIAGVQEIFDSTKVASLAGGASEREAA